MPPRLRSRVAALRASTVSLARPGDAVDAETLVTLAQACEGRERVVLRYRDRAQRATERRVEPHLLVATGRRWYVAAYDVDRRAWRTLRVDRILEVRRTGHRFPPGETPDLVALVQESITTSPYRHQATVILAAPPDIVATKVPATVAVVRPHGEGSLLIVGADDLDVLAGNLVAIGIPFRVLEPPELRDLVVAIGRRLVDDHRSVRGTQV